LEEGDDDVFSPIGRKGIKSCFSIQLQLLTFYTPVADKLYEKDETLQKLLDSERKIGSVQIFVIFHLSSQN
jgi:hypothetical protein